MVIIKLGCVWCGTGWIRDDDGLCGKCGRSQDIAREEMIEKKKAAATTDWFRSSTDYARESRLRRKYA